MALKFKVGDEVVQIIPAAIAAKIVAPVIVDNDIHWEVQWTDADGHIRQRTFNEDQIAAVPAA